MQPLLEEAGLIIEIPTGKVKNTITLNWIVTLHDGPWSQANKIKNLLSQDKWDYYKIMGFTGLREQDLLKEALDTLVKAWKTNRPKYFNKKVKNEKSKQNSNN